MLASTRTADAIHILVLISLAETSITSQSLATSLVSHPSHVRRLMSLLRNSGILKTSRGKAEPMLQRAPSQITLWDVYQIMENTTRLLPLNTHTNPDCHDGVHIQLALQDSFDELQQQFEKEMKEVILEKIIQDYKKRLEKSNTANSHRVILIHSDLKTSHLFLNFRKKEA